MPPCAKEQAKSSAKRPFSAGQRLSISEKVCENSGPTRCVAADSATSRFYPKADLGTTLPQLQEGGTATSQVSRCKQLQSPSSTLLEQKRRQMSFLDNTGNFRNQNKIRKPSASLVFVSPPFVLHSPEVGSSGNYWPRVIRKNESQGRCLHIHAR